jgi:hypothetical protein
MRAHEDEMSEPSPGSDAAIKMGCTCPVIDNGHGRGYMGQPGIFVYIEGCPVHRFDFKSDEPFVVGRPETVLRVVK